MITASCCYYVKMVIITGYSKSEKEKADKRKAEDENSREEKSIEGQQ